MGTNEIQNFMIRTVKMLGQSCSCCVKKYPYHSCTMLLLFVLYLFSPLVFTLLSYCLPVTGLAYLLYRIVIGTGCRTVKNARSRSKTWRELRFRRSCRSVYGVHVPKQCNESSFMQDPLGGLQNARERSDKSFNDMNAEEKDVFSKLVNDNLVDKKALVEEDPRGKGEVAPVDRYRLDENYRKCSLDDCKVKKQESLDDGKHGCGNKAIGWIDDDEKKSLMDLGISEVERNKRLEGLMERRRSRTLSKFQMIRNAMVVGVGIGNNSSAQISSLHIPKKNPFLSKNLGDLNSPLPGSAPTYMIKSNPFDLPYDPHEEKPILTGDSFEDEFMATHQKEPAFCRHEGPDLGDFAHTESTNDTREMYFDTEFAIKQLRRLGTSKFANNEDDNKQDQEKRSTPKPNAITNDNHTIEEGESSNKVVVLVNHAKEHEVEHDVVSSDHSTSSSSSSEDEPIRRPNKEAILHCLSMSRMRVISQGKSLLRNAESFDCGPSALFDKSKTDCFFFGFNKRIHYGSTNSFASDMQVEVSDVGSSTNLSSIDEESKGTLANSTEPSEMDMNEARLRDIDEVSGQGTT